MAKKFVKIEDGTYADLEKIARDNGFDSVEKFLTQFAKDFSTGCSVTIKSRRPEAA